MSVTEELIIPMEARAIYFNVKVPAGTGANAGVNDGPEFTARFIIPLYEFPSGRLDRELTLQYIDVDSVVRVNLIDKTTGDSTSWTTYGLVQSVYGAPVPSYNYKVTLISKEVVPNAVPQNKKPINSRGLAENTLMSANGNFQAVFATASQLSLYQADLGMSDTFIKLLLLNSNLSNNLQSSRFFFEWVNDYANIFSDPGFFDPTNYYNFNNPTLNNYFDIPLDAVTVLAFNSNFSVTKFTDMFAFHHYVLLPILQSNPTTSYTVDSDPINGDKFIIHNEAYPGTAETTRFPYPLTIFHDNFGTCIIRQDLYNYIQVPKQKTRLNKAGDIPIYNYWFIKSDGFPMISNIEPTVPCLLKGTKVLTPDGYKNIEHLAMNNNILNHEKKTMRIRKISNRKIKWEENLSDDKRMFKIDGPEPIYLTGYHKVQLDDGSFQEAHNCYLPFAKKEEYVDKNGFFEIYHIHVDDWSNNHLIVNGGKVVESWSGVYDKST